MNYVILEAMSSQKQLAEKNFGNMLCLVAFPKFYFIKKSNISYVVRLNLNFKR